jgi:hypothetical protein
MIADDPKIQLRVFGNCTVAPPSSKVLTDVTVGETYYLGVRNVTNVTVLEGSVALALGTDYTLEAAEGLITILGDGTVVDGDDLVVSFSVVEPVLGIADDVEELVQQNESGSSSVLERLTVLLETAALPGLQVGDELRLTGTDAASPIPTSGRTVEVRERYRVHEGRMTQIVCREVA